MNCARDSALTSRKWFPPYSMTLKDGVAVELTKTTGVPTLTVMTWQLKPAPKFFINTMWTVFEGQLFRFDDDGPVVWVRWGLLTVLALADPKARNEQAMSARSKVTMLMPLVCRIQVVVTKNPPLTFR